MYAYVLVSAQSRCADQQTTTQDADRSAAYVTSAAGVGAAASEVQLSQLHAASSR
jgi:hypothetical protein